MPGFFCEIRSGKLNKQFSSVVDSLNLLVESTEGNGFYVERRTVRKFLNDKVLCNDERYLILTEGVILNSKSLIKKYGKENLRDTVIEMYEKSGEAFFNEFRGSFSGVLYDKKLNKWLIYTNHVGDKWVFYSVLEDGIVVGSELPWVASYLKKNGIRYSFDEFGAYCLLTYGYMLEDYTLIKEVKRLLPGHYIKIENGKVTVNQYFKLDNTPDETQSEEEIIENVDRLFRRAIELEFEKDREYGYKHIATLSAGLDSRMVVWVAHEMGYTEQLNVTFSQTNYLDETVPKKIASDLKHEWLFKSLDNGIYLKSATEMIDITGGLVLYSGSAHTNSCVKLINFSNFGLYHTAQLGDVILGTYYDAESPNAPYVPGTGAYSKELVAENEQNYLKMKYENLEIFKFYNRGFNGILSGNLPVQRWTEVTSPFLDVDFLTYSITIPLKYRYDHRIYKKWILKKYPKAAEYVWEKIQGRITERVYSMMGYKFTLRGLYRRAISKLLYGSSSNSKWHMNPFEYWYRTNDDLKNYFEERFNNVISIVPNCVKVFPDHNFRDLIGKLFYNYGVVEKTQALTILEAWRYYFEDLV